MNVAAIKKIIYSFFRLFPLSKNKVFLFSYYGEQYSGSPKYIGQYLSKNTNLDVVWSFVKPEEHPKYCGKSVKYGHILHYFHLATAGTVITNYRMTDEFVRRSAQKYIQTWHSSLRLKMIENDAVDTLPPNYVTMSKHDSRQISCLLAGSEKSRQIFERAFWYKGKIANVGTPQCDILFDKRETYTEKVRQAFGIQSGTKIALYAPTFRKDNKLDVYKLDFEALTESFEKCFGGKWVILMRLHPHLSASAGYIEYSDKVISATKYDDVQELLCSADALISDYSAIMFDYALTKRPCFLYVPDLAEYTSNDRGLYFDIRELPFLSSESEGELRKQIEGFSEKEYEKKVSAFLDEIGSFDDGKASSRVYDLIIGG